MATSDDTPEVEQLKAQASALVDLEAVDKSALTEQEAQLVAQYAAKLLDRFDISLDGTRLCLTWKVLYEMWDGTHYDVKHVTRARTNTTLDDWIAIYRKLKAAQALRELVEIQAKNDLLRKSGWLE